MNGPAQILLIKPNCVNFCIERLFLCAATTEMRAVGFPGKRERTDGTFGFGERVETTRTLSTKEVRMIFRKGRPTKRASRWKKGSDQ